MRVHTVISGTRTAGELVLEVTWQFESSEEQPEDTCKELSTLQSN